MARIGLSRLYHVALRQCPVIGHGRAAALASAPQPPAPAKASPARRGLATESTTPTTTDRSPTTVSSAAAAPGVRPQDEEAGEEQQEEGEVLDEAAARRAELLKRYGDRTPPPGPKAVKAEPGKGDAAAATGGFDVEKAAASEVNHNEIWGDYVSYMEHQRKKGWKT